MTVVAPPAPPSSDGRSLRWRLGALLIGLLFAGAGWGLWRHPEFLSYFVATGLGLAALLCVASAILAKGR